MFGVYVKTDSEKMHLIKKDLSPAESYEEGMAYTEEEASEIAKRWIKEHREDGGAAFIAQDG